MNDDFNNNSQPEHILSHADLMNIAKTASKDASLSTNQTEPVVSFVSSPSTATQSNDQQLLQQQQLQFNILSAQQIQQQQQQMAQAGLINYHHQLSQNNFANQITPFQSQQQSQFNNDNLMMAAAFQQQQTLNYNNAFNSYNNNMPPQMQHQLMQQHQQTMQPNPTLISSLSTQTQPQTQTQTQTQTEAQTEPVSLSEQDPPKRKRGRPRKEDAAKRDAVDNKEKKMTAKDLNNNLAELTARYNYETEIWKAHVGTLQTQKELQELRLKDAAEAYETLKKTSCDTSETIKMLKEHYQTKDKEHVDQMAMREKLYTAALDERNHFQKLWENMLVKNQALSEETIQLKQQISELEIQKKGLEESIKNEKYRFEILSVTLKGRIQDLNFRVNQAPKAAMAATMTKTEAMETMDLEYSADDASPLVEEKGHGRRRKKQKTLTREQQQQLALKSPRSVLPINTTTTTTKTEHKEVKPIAAFSNEADYDLPVCPSCFGCVSEETWETNCKSCDQCWDRAANQHRSPCDDSRHTTYQEYKNERGTHTSHKH